MGGRKLNAFDPASHEHLRSRSKARNPMKEPGPIELRRLDLR